MIVFMFYSVQLLKKLLRIFSIYRSIKHICLTVWIDKCLIYKLKHIQ